VSEVVELLFVLLLRLRSERRLQALLHESGYLTQYNAIRLKSHKKLDESEIA
jgi:hypothetical protein